MFKRALAFFAISTALLPAGVLGWDGAILFDNYYGGISYYPQINYGAFYGHGAFYNPGYTFGFTEYSKTINMSKYYNYNYNYDYNSYGTTAYTNYTNTNWGFGGNQYLQVNHGLTHSGYISSGSSISSRFGVTATRF